MTVNTATPAAETSPTVPTCTGLSSIHVARPWALNDVSLPPRPHADREAQESRGADRARGQRAGWLQRARPVAAEDGEHAGHQRDRQRASSPAEVGSGGPGRLTSAVDSSLTQELGLGAPLGAPVKPCPQREAPDLLTRREAENER